MSDEKKVVIEANVMLAGFEVSSEIPGESPSPIISSPWPEGMAESIAGMGAGDTEGGEVAFEEAREKLLTTPLPGMRHAVQAVILDKGMRGIALELSAAIDDWRKTV